MESEKSGDKYKPLEDEEDGEGEEEQEESDRKSGKKTEEVTEEEIEDLIEEDHRDDWAKRRTRLILSGICAASYPILICLYLVYRHQMWEWNMRFCEWLSTIGGSWTDSYQEFFAEYLDRFFPAGDCVFVLFGVDKAVSIKTGLVYIWAMHSRNFLRDWLEEERPYYLSTKLKGDCACSFGMPSGHVEGAATMYGFLLYVSVIHSRSISRSGKLAGIAVWLFIVLSMCFSMIRSGRHSLVQCLLSVHHSLFWMAVMCLGDPWLTSMSRGLIGGKRGKAEIWLLSVGTAILCGWSWLYYLEPLITHYKAPTRVRCISCLADHNAAIRMRMTRVFSTSISAVGMVAGITVTGARSTERNDDIFMDHMSLEGLSRLFFLLLLNIFYFMKFNVKLDEFENYLFCSGLCLAASFLFFVGFPKITQCLGLQFKGDLKY